MQLVVWRISYILISVVLSYGLWKVKNPDAERGALISGQAAPLVSGPRLAEQDIATKPPFVGDFGFDVDGYSRQRPDRVQLLNLLRLSRFDELDRFIDYYQDEFERDFRKEYWPDYAFNAFDVSEPALGPLLDRWIETHPNSFAAHAARGTYRTALGWHYRGHDYANETTRRQFMSFEEYLDAARRDYQRARELRPGAVAVHRRLMHVEMAYPRRSVEKQRADMNALLNDALTRCPLCFEVRATMLLALRPRWHGSYQTMDEFVALTKSRWSDNPRLRLLAGLADSDFCDAAWERKELGVAKIACDKSLRPGDWTRTLMQAARLYAGPLHDDKRARELSERALRIDPQDLDALEVHQSVLGRAGEYEQAAHELLLLRQLNPTSERLAKHTQWLVDKLRYDGSQASKLNKTRDATRMFTIALKLAPDDHDLLNRLGYAEKTQDLSPASIAAQLAAAPDDYDVHRRIDSGLSASGRFAEASELWSAYIARHPTDPRGFVERGGCKWHLRQAAPALEDMRRACELGMQKACGDVEKMKAIAGL